MNRRSILTSNEIMQDRQTKSIFFEICVSPHNTLTCSRGAGVPVANGLFYENCDEIRIEF